MLPAYGEYKALDDVVITLFIFCVAQVDVCLRWIHTQYKSKALEYTTYMVWPKQDVQWQGQQYRDVIVLVWGTPYSIKNAFWYVLKNSLTQKSVLFVVSRQMHLDPVAF